MDAQNLNLEAQCSVNVSVKTGQKECRIQIYSELLFRVCINMSTPYM